MGEEYLADRELRAWHSWALKEGRLQAPKYTPDRADTSQNVGASRLIAGGQAVPDKNRQRELVISKKA
jgi:hypothetical protein